MKAYNPKEIEPKWQKYWDENQTFAVQEDPSKEKFYALIEFPYPSGAGLHVGHPRPFTAMDVVSRKRRMQGQNVLFPIGFDAFGLPTENYAIKTGRPPVEVTAENIATFTRQLKSLGFGFDWSRQVDTTDPEYMKWTQWIFLQFFKHGLAYKRNQPINWCPKDKIGLANEEVVNGCCERCGTAVEQRDKEQWMLSITKYADSLLEGLKTVDYIPQARIQQENWIGKSEGADIVFPLRDISGQNDTKHTITVFTTRPDTIFGVTFLAISAELAKSWMNVGWETKNEVKEYIEKTLNEQVGGVEDGEKEKTGIDAQILAVNPVNGKEIPVWITNYVMGGVGTGAVMGVPGHDERDWDFAKKYNLPIEYVVAQDTGKRIKNPARRDSVAAVFVRPEDNKILVMYDKLDEMYRLPAGGIEPGESLEQTVSREITEETGYVNFTLGEKLAPVYGQFFAKTKNLNREKLLSGFVVYLNDQQQVPLSAEDAGVCDFYWVTPEEALKLFLTDREDYGEELLVEQYVKGKFCFPEHGIACYSEFLDLMSTAEAKEKMIQYLEEKGIGKRKINYKLRDWVFSRQRYWGEPIPLVNCEKCKGWVALPEDQLPLTLPKVEKYEPTDTGESPLATMTDWVNTTCPQCGGPAKRETDTMPNWAGSSWYFLRYMDPHNSNDFFSAKPFTQRPAIVPTENDHSYFSAFEEIYYPLEQKGVSIWMVNRFLLNGLNGALWLPLRTIAFMAHENDVSHITTYLKDLGYSATTQEKWGHEFMKGQIRVEMVPVFKDEKGFYAFTPKGARQDVQPNDLPQNAMGKMFDRAYKIVSPEYNLSHYEYINTHEQRQGHGDEEKIDFLREWIQSMNQKFRYWKQVDWYNGGMEHTVLHLLYSRFWNQFLFDIGVIPTKEPYKKRTSHGMILAEDGRKMSKSLGNVVNPDEMVEKFGADALRTYIMFMGPFDQAVAWDTNGLVGVKRFLERVWNLQQKVKEDHESTIVALLHQTIKKVTEDIEKMAFNTAIAKMMELSNEMSKLEQVFKLDYIHFVKMVAPFAPHMAEELWSELGQKGSVAYASWPEYDEALAKETAVKIVVQINGKVRDSFDGSPDMSEEEAKEKALACENVIKHLNGQEPKKVLYIKGKLVSIVV